MKFFQFLFMHLFYLLITIVSDDIYLQ